MWGNGVIKMGKFFNRVKKVGHKISEKANEISVIEKGAIDYDDFDYMGDDFKKDDPKEDFLNKFEVDIQPAQKPESFHHFLLQNQYRDLELMIRGYKMVFNKTTNKWETKRKEKHCFTDEESESIVRLAESHLSPDIKLSYISLTSYPIKMLMIKAQMDECFYNIADYKYGRYENSKEQFFMKQDNLNILMALMSRIEANYSRAIKGSENKSTHGSVKAQESLSNTEKDVSGDRGYY